ncbi:MAG: TolC family protein [Acidobacteria bacterium]|nr:TolC family protein [Acidobacteriota bacterium]
MRSIWLAALLEQALLAAACACAAAQPPPAAPGLRREAPEPFSIRMAKLGAGDMPACAPPCAAEPQALTIAAAIHAAETHYPKVRASEEQQSAAHAAAGIARAAYWPRADLLWQTNRATANNIYGLLLPQPVIPSISGPVLPGDVTRSAWSSAGGVLFSWQPFDFGARSAQVSASLHGAEAARAALHLTQLEVAMATAGAWFDVATAEQVAAALRANAARLEVFSKSVHVLAGNQLRPGADAAQADAQLARARTQVIEAETNVEVRRAALSELVGIPAPAPDYAPLLALPGEANANTPLAGHPAAQQQAELVRQQQARLSVIAASYVPQFQALGALSGRGAGTALNGIFPGGTAGLAPSAMNWAAGMQVSFPAFDFFSIRAQKNVQAANLGAERARYDQLLDDLSAAVQQAAARLAGARLAALNTPVELEAARQSEAQQRARFQAGLGTVIEVAAAESLLAQAECDNAVARLNVWRALAALAAARGDLAPFLAQAGD